MISQIGSLLLTHLFHSAILLVGCQSYFPGKISQRTTVVYSFPCIVCSCLVLVRRHLNNNVLFGPPCVRRESHHHHYEVSKTKGTKKAMVNIVQSQITPEGLYTYIQGPTTHLVHFWRAFFLLKELL